MKNKDIPYLAYLELRRKVRGVKYFAEIDVTDNCNLRCGHCYHFHGKDDFEKEELSQILSIQFYQFFYL